MAVYNRDFTLVKRALDSVMAQDFRDFEMIVVDDGSSASLSREIVDYTARHEDRMTYIRHRNAGQAIAANKGILVSTGRYIGLIDCDDEYKPNHISACLASIGTYDLIASNTENITTSQADLFVPCKDDTSRSVFIDDCIVFGSLFGKREVFENVPFRKVFAIDPDFYHRAGERYSTTKLDLRTYKYYMGLPDSYITQEREKRKS